MVAFSNRSRDMTQAMWRRPKAIEGTIVLIASMVSSEWASQWLLEAIVNLNSTYREAELARGKKNKVGVTNVPVTNTVDPKKGVLVPLCTNVLENASMRWDSPFWKVRNGFIKESLWYSDPDTCIYVSASDSAQKERNHNFSDLNPKMTSFFLKDQDRVYQREHMVFRSRHVHLRFRERQCPDGKEP